MAKKVSRGLVAEADLRVSLCVDVQWTNFVRDHIGIFKVLESLSTLTIFTNIYLEKDNWEYSVTGLHNFIL